MTHFLNALLKAEQCSFTTSAGVSGLLIYDSLWTSLACNGNYFLSDAKERRSLWHEPWHRSFVWLTGVSAHLRHTAPSVPPNTMTVKAAPRRSVSTASVRISSAWSLERWVLSGLWLHGGSQGHLSSWVTVHKHGPVRLQRGSHFLPLSRALARKEMRVVHK